MDILYKCITPIRAEEATWRTNSSRVAFWQTKEGYRSQMQEWRNMAAPLDENAGKATINPSAEKWFIENNIPYRLGTDSSAQ